MPGMCMHIAAGEKGSVGQKMRKEGWNFPILLLLGVVGTTIHLVGIRWGRLMYNCFIYAEKSYRICSWKIR